MAKRTKFKFGENAFNANTDSLVNIKKLDLNSFLKESRDFETSVCL